LSGQSARAFLFYRGSKSVRNQVLVRPVLLALVACAGCGDQADEFPREAVSGTVTFEDKPLASGMILFLPATGRGDTQAGGPITNGSFNIARAGGPVPGTYTVVITAAAEASSAPPAAPGKELALPKEFVPAKYNTRSKLTAEVKQGAENRFAFALTK
jgi:hypothetical protein